MIVGFVIVFYFLFRLNITDTANNEICRLSVLSRATAPESVNTYIPLQCTTEKICLSSALFGGKCKEFAGEQNVIPVRLSGSEQAKADKIEDIIANEMFDCWSMFGEGKLSLFSGGLMKQYSLSQTELTCVICSRIAVDLEDPNPQTPQNEAKVAVYEKINLKEYLATQKIPNSNKRYIEAFTDDETVTYPKFDGAIVAQQEAIKKELQKIS